MRGEDEEKDLLVEWLRERLRVHPADADVALMLGIALRDPLVLDEAEGTRLRQLAGTHPQGVRAIILRDAALRLLARTRWG